MTRRHGELIIVRSLAESDLGLFASQRPLIKAKQRAININSDVARLLLAPKLFKHGETRLDCTCIFGRKVQRTERRFRKTHKNWRLGGPKIEGKALPSSTARTSCCCALFPQMTVRIRL